MRHTSLHVRPLQRGLDSLAAALALAAALGWAPLAHTAPVPIQGAGPFTLGERWSSAASPSLTWLPDSVVFAGGDELVVSASRGMAGGLAVKSAHAAQGAPDLAFDGRFQFAYGAPEVVAGERADAVYSLAQYPAPDLFSRRVEVTRHNPVQAARGAAFVPVWTHELDVRINAPARIVCDAAGEIVVAAAFDDQSGNVRIDRLVGATGALVARRDLPASGLTRLALSADGRRVAIAAGLALWILDEQGQILTQRSLASATHVLAFSADGRALAIGGTGRVDLLREISPSVWSVAKSFLGAAQELAAVGALGSDAGALAIGWWDFTTGTSARLELWDVAAEVRTASYTLAGTPISTQNLPSACVLSSDGQRAAFGLWGDGANAEVLLLEAGRPLPVVAFDLPGSVRALDLDESGTRIAVAHKSVHNSQWGATGAVRLLDTGERALELLTTPTFGGTLAVATRRPGASLALILLGRPAHPGYELPGVEGRLLLDRASLRVMPVITDASGRADLNLPLPATPALLGVKISVQAAYRVTGGVAFSPQRIDALVL